MATWLLPVVSLALSLISTAIALASFRRSRRLQDFEYAPRLQLEAEQVRGGYSLKDVFHYSAELVNHGLKPVEIDAIYLDYGGKDLADSLHLHVEGNAHLPPNGRRAIECRRSKGDYEEVVARFGLKNCLFRLRVRYFNSTGGLVETERRLMSIGSDGIGLYAQRGDALT